MQLEEMEVELVMVLKADAAGLRVNLSHTLLNVQNLYVLTMLSDKNRNDQGMLGISFLVT